MFQIGAFAVIFDEHGRVLLCHGQDIDVWNLPGGAMEQGESPWEAAIREVEEEVGLVVAIERLAGGYFKLKLHNPCAAARTLRALDCPVDRSQHIEGIGDGLFR